ncbi:MAG TPA: tetratricopeptide repeat protein [Steroidobacteraceae bacterium]|nr:tetratricopeptide repeat protein [Steroidobacteraceae bacterium]
MHLPTRIAAALLLAVVAVPALPAERGRGCPRGDAWSLSIGAERSLERGAWPEAARDYACAARASTDAAVAERATRTAYDNLQLERAAESARRWLALAPDSEVARRYLATSLLRLYDEDGAAEQFAALLETSYADRARGYVVLLGILSGEDNDTGAARVMERLAAGDASLPEAQYAAAMLWQRAEHGGRALAAVERALALRPDYPQAEYARVRALTTVGRHDEALVLSTRLAASGDPFMRLAHAWQLLGEERRNEAATLFEEIRREGNAASADAASALASIAIDESRLQEAERLLEDAARDPEQAAGALWQRARIAEERGDEAGAARMYQAIETGPRALGAQLRAYRLLQDEGAPEMAEMLIDDYLDSAPGDGVDVVAGVAANLVEDGHGDEAIALIDRARDLLPGDSLLLARAFLLERLDRVAEAVADMRKVAQHRPADPTALNALGYTLVDRTRSVEEGTKLIERAIAEKPDSYAIQDSMGWALVQAGRLDEGKAWLDKAWTGSEDPEVAAHLGETLWRMGRTAEAKKLWDEALAENPESRPLKRAIEARAE